MVKLVDEDQQGKALSIQGQGIPKLDGQTVFHINQYAGKAYREAFVEFIKDQHKDFFEDNADDLDLLDAANEQAEKDVIAFIGKHCQKYE